MRENIEEIKNICVCCDAKFGKHEWCYGWFRSAACECPCIYNVSIL
ncbi:MAG: hypothetical protein AABY22_20565 [Nanoarchaeota archaeon]